MGSGSGFEETHIYVSLLKCLTNLEVDWPKFAAEVGIKAVNNAQRKLKGVLKNDGLQLVGGMITPIGGQTPAKTPTKRKKSENGNDREADAETPSKKARVEDADDDDDDDEV